jgi:hypothetical protein
MHVMQIRKGHPMKSSLRITALVMFAAFAALVYVTGSAAAAGSGSGGGGAPGARPAPPRGPQFIAPAAKYLAMKPAALQKQLKSKKTLAAVAKARGKSVDGLKDAIVADAKAHLTKDVAAGRIDQDAADDRLADLQSRIDAIVSKPQPARGPGGGNCPNHPAGGAGAANGGANGGAAPATGAGDYGNGATTGGGTTGGTGATGGGDYL